MVESIYLKALTYSSKEQFKGVTYIELRNHIESVTGEKFNPTLCLTFFQFVLDTHYWTSSEIGDNTKQEWNLIMRFRNLFEQDFQPKESYENTDEKLFIKFTREERYYLNSEGDKRLVDYTELREARINAKQAYKISLFAIGISLLALLISPLIEKAWSLL